MIFGKELLPKVLDGSKTVTRRPVKCNETGKILPCKYKVGRDYALQPVIEEGPGKGRGGKAVGRILIKSERVGPLAWANRHEEVRREGFDVYSDLFLYIVRLYPGQRILLSTEFHRIEFELVEVEG